MRRGVANAPLLFLLQSLSIKRSEADDDDYEDDAEKDGITIKCHRRKMCRRYVLSSCRMLSVFLVRFSKWLQSVKKGVIDLFLCIAMAYNVFPCTEIIRNTQTEKIADFTM